MAEGVGFEPTVPCSTAVFKTAALSHSATPPRKAGQQDTRRAKRAHPLVLDSALPRPPRQRLVRERPSPGDQVVQIRAEAESPHEERQQGRDEKSFENPCEHRVPA